MVITTELCPAPRGPDLGVFEQSCFLCVVESCYHITAHMLMQQCHITPHPNLPSPSFPQDPDFQTATKRPLYLVTVRLQNGLFVLTQRTNVFYFLFLSIGIISIRISFFTYRNGPDLPQIKRSDCNSLTLVMNF